MGRSLERTFSIPSQLAHLKLERPLVTPVVEGLWKTPPPSPLLPGGPLERPGSAQGKGTSSHSGSHSHLGQPPSPQESQKKTFAKEKAFQLMGMLSKCPETISYPKMLQVVPDARGRDHGHRAWCWGQGDYPWASVALTRLWGTPGDEPGRCAEPGSLLGVVLSFSSA